MSNKKQSSIQWLEQMVKNMIINGGCVDLLAVIEHIQQAKAMHKEEIMDAFQHGKWDWHEVIEQGIPSKDPAEYYNETFGGQDETNSI